MTVPWEAPEIGALLAIARERGCVDESELAQVVEALDLDHEQVEAIAARVHEDGGEVLDDCGLRNAPPTEVTHRELAGYTTDALQLFLNEAGPPPPADARRGARARQGDRARRPRGQGADDQLEPAPRRLDRPQVPGRRRAQPARPHPGGHARADPRGREVRLAQGLPLLDLRHAVDPPGDRRARSTSAGARSACRSTSPSASARSPPPSASWPPGSAAPPTLEEIAEEAELAAEQVEEMRDVARNVTCSTPVGDDGEAELGDLLPGARAAARGGGRARARARGRAQRRRQLPDRERT